MMRILVFSLTGLAVLLFILQYFGEKGTRSHIARGMLVGTFSLAVVVINTVEISLKTGLTWDLPFLIHVFFGTVFFISLALTAVIGFFLRTDRTLIKIHRLLANFTGLMLLLSLAVLPLLWIFR